jgi:hypothetical protein
MTFHKSTMRKQQMDPWGNAREKPTKGLPSKIKYTLRETNLNTLYVFCQFHFPTKQNQMYIYNLSRFSPTKIGTCMLHQ